MVTINNPYGTLDQAIETMLLMDYTVSEIHHNLVEFGYRIDRGSVRIVVVRLCEELGLVR